MRKLIVLFCVIALIGITGNSAMAESSIKIKPVQYFYHSGFSSYSVGIGFEKAGHAGRFGIQHNLDLDFTSVNPLLRYKPDFRIYILNDAPDGLYVAIYFTIGATTDKLDSESRETVVAYGAGVAPGYQFLFGKYDQFSVDAQFALGFSGIYDIVDLGKFGTFKNNDIGFGMIPNIGFGFFFGN